MFSQVKTFWDMSRSQTAEFVGLVRQAANNLGEIAQTLKAMNETLTSVKVDLDSIEVKLAEVSRDVDEMTQRIRSVETAVDNIQQFPDTSSLESGLGDIEKEIKSFRQAIVGRLP